MSFEEFWEKKHREKNNQSIDIDKYWGGRSIDPVSISKYRSKGYLDKDCLIDCHGEVDGCPPSFHRILAELFGKTGYKCVQTIQQHNLDIPVMVFECPPYYRQDSSLLIEAAEIKNKEAADRLLAIDDSAEYLLFTAMSDKDPLAKGWPMADTTLKFLGVYSVDKCESILAHSFVWRLSNERYSFG